MKKLAVLAVLLLLCFQTSLHAQEREPLAMRIMLDWTVGGVIVGALVGGAIWLTDPGREGNNVSDQVLGGAAWGSLAGAAWAISILNDTAIAPVLAQVPLDPLHPARRITGDPILDEERRQDLLAGSPGHGGSGRAFVLPLLNLRF